MVRVQPTRGGKGGKTVTVIRGLELDAAGFKALLKKLKTQIGSGGSAKDGVIERSRGGLILTDVEGLSRRVEEAMGPIRP